VEIKACRSNLPTKELREDDELGKEAFDSKGYVRHLEVLKQSMKLDMLDLGLLGKVTYRKGTRIVGNLRTNFKETLKKNPKVHLIPFGKRCKCPRCVDWEQQCCHELCGDRFQLEKNSPRLFNDIFLPSKICMETRGWRS